MRKMSELQWLKLGYVLNDDAEGSYEWNNRYCTYKLYRYTEDNVHFDVERAKEFLRKHRKEKEKSRKEMEEYKKQQEEIEDRYWEWLRKYLDNWHTTCQWLDMGFVPNNDAKWKNGKEVYREANLPERYYYCHKDDVTKNEVLAQKLSDNYPVGIKYDGRPWW